MAARTITQPATGSSLASAVVRGQLQILEDEIASPSSIDPGHLHTIAALDVSGIPSATTFLRGDGSWATPSTSALFYTPTGGIDGSNQTFGVSGQPTSVIGDGITYFEGHGYSYAALQVVLDIPPSSYIRYTL